MQFYVLCNFSNLIKEKMKIYDNKLVHKVPLIVITLEQIYSKLITITEQPIRSNDTNQMHSTGYVSFQTKVQILSYLS
jgi:hypothetical protein